MREYKPHTDSFPDRTLKYLKDHGESKNADIREAIGLNQWSKDHSCFHDRSSYHFDIVIDRLQKAGLIVRTKVGFYRLANSKEEAAEFIRLEHERERERMIKDSIKQN